MVERNGTEFKRQYVLRAVDDDLKQPVQTQRGGDLGADADQRLKNLQLALGHHQAGVLERAADSFRHGGKKELIVFVEWLAALC